MGMTIRHDGMGRERCVGRCECATYNTRSGRSETATTSERVAKNKLMTISERVGKNSPVTNWVRTRNLILSGLMVFISIIPVANAQDSTVQDSAVQSSVNQSQSEPQTTIVGQIFQTVAEVFDKEIIDMILYDFFIPADLEDITKVEVIDITGNGYGNNDVLILYPMETIYAIEGPSPELVEIMRSWSFDEFRRDAENLPADEFYPVRADSLVKNDLLIPEEERVNVAQAAVLSDLIASLDRNYQDDDINIRFQRDENGLTFQFWNFNNEALAFTPRPPAVSDTVNVFDLMQITVFDSTIVADTTFYDMLMIHSTVEETVYLPWSGPGSPPPGYEQKTNEAILNSRREE